MTDVPASQRRGIPPLGELMKRLHNSLKQGEIILASGVIAVLTVLIFPMPAWMLDLSLALSITFSVLILMTALFTERPLDFSSFPTVLLISTMLRLALNLASTRLILENGHEGTHAAGAVIGAFGTLIMGGNFVIGVIVFAILLIVNFIVITKGSGRIAEVAARFTLDAMPGKQMAIDADLSTGLIDDKEARKRRRELEDESGFFGAMDGAAKFVRGDAVAGLLITAINIIGGIIIGVAQNGVSIGQALHSYTTLSVGDGLVSQFPALIVSTAAGLMVTKAGVQGTADKALFGQLGGSPQALVMASILMLGLSILPGMPMLPFLVLGAGAGYAAYVVDKKRRSRAAAEVKAEADASRAAPAEEPISNALAIDAIRLELGYGLIALINDATGVRLTDQIKALRRQLAAELGFVMPSVRILDNVQLPSSTYVLRVKEVEVARGDIRPHMLLAMDPRGAAVALPGEATVEPTFGLTAAWIDQALREEATFRGYTVVDPSTVVTTHLTEVVRDNMSELLSYAETQKLLDELPKAQQKLVSDLVPNRFTVAGIQRVLQQLLSERVSIRDLPTILEGIGEACGASQNIVQITEHVRSRLARQISAANMTPAGYIPLLPLSQDWEFAFAEALQGPPDDRQLNLAPSRLQQFIQSVRAALDRPNADGDTPVLLTSPTIRPYVRSIVERFRPHTVVLSQNEIHPRVRIRTLGQV